MPEQKTLRELAEIIEAELRGDSACVIKGVGTLQSAEQGQLSFLDNPVYRKLLPHTQASAVILAAKDVENCPTNALIVDDPYFAYAKLAGLFVEKSPAKPGIHKTAVIGKHTHIDKTASIGPQVVVEDGVSVGANTTVGPGCVIGESCQIGADCHLEANVSLYHHCQIADRVIIHSGAVIGADGFGIAEKNGIWHKVPQLGRVLIHSDVEVGANTTIDRGALGDTVIEEGVKLDNQIQIGHNVRIGAHTAMAACAGVSGSTRIGRHCKIGGGAGLNGHLQIADYTVVTGMAMVTNSVKTPGIYSSGTGFMPNHEWKKNVARFRQLDRMLRRLTSSERENSAAKQEKLAAYSAFNVKRTPAMTDKIMGINEIFKHIPQRPPFLLIDRVSKFTPHKNLTAIKNVTINEGYFQGHFPGHPIMPGVLILEALAQACTVFAFLTTGEDPSAGGIYYFAGIDKARFKRPVEPGDQLILDVEFLKAKRGIWKMKGVASVGGEVVCNAELLSAKANEGEK